MATFDIALSGLSAASSALDITSNNIANANTVGFKNSKAQFADVYAAGAVDLNNSTAGEGVRLVDAAQQFTQGDITTTSSNLDLALSGNGFFTLNTANGNVYTRNGEFSKDQNGNVVSSTGGFLQVYPPLANGGFNTGALQNLNLNTGQSAPVATSTGTVILNLPSNETAPTVVPFDPTNPATYSQSTSTTVYDSLGNSYPATYYFTQTATLGPVDRRYDRKRHGRGRTANSEVLEYRSADHARQRQPGVQRLRPAGRCRGHEHEFQFQPDNPIWYAVRCEFHHTKRLHDRAAQHGLHRRERRRVRGLYQRTLDAARAARHLQLSQSAGTAATGKQRLGTNLFFGHGGAGNRRIRPVSAAFNREHWKAPMWI